MSSIYIYRLFRFPSASVCCVARDPIIFNRRPFSVLVGRLVSRRRGQELSTAATFPVSLLLAGAGTLSFDIFTIVLFYLFVCFYFLPTSTPHLLFHLIVRVECLKKQKRSKKKAHHPRSRNVIYSRMYIYALIRAAEQKETCP